MIISGANEQKYVFDYTALYRFIVLLSIINILGPGIIVLQYEMLHHVYLLGSSLKGIEVILAFLWVIRYVVKRNTASVSLPKYIINPYLLWIFYGLISICLAVLVQGSVLGLLWNYNSEMFIPILFITFGLQPYEIVYTDSISMNIHRVIGKEKLYNRIGNLMYILAFAVWPLGIMQYLLNNTIIPISIPNANYTMLSVNEFTHVRASSFFLSGAQFAQFSSALVFIALSRLVLSSRGWFKSLDFVIILVGLVCVYMSETRTDYIYVLLGIITFFVIIINAKGFFRKASTFNKLPYIYLIFMILILLFIEPIYSAEFQGSGMASTQTLVSRFVEWRHVINAYFYNATSVVSVIFGYGVIQGGRYIDNNLIIDNTFLSLFVYQGIVGLMMFLFLFNRVWILACNSVVKSFGWYESTVLMKLSVFLATGLISNYSTGSYLTYMFFYILIVGMLDTNLVG